MERTFNLAEMANTADYSAMNYGQLLETKIAMLWAIFKANSLLKTKRFEEMEKLTHDYVEAMNRYCSTKTETFDLLEKEEFWSDPTISFESNVVDEQEAVIHAIEMENNQDKGENSPVLPDPPVSSQDNIDVDKPMDPQVDVIPAILGSTGENAIKEVDCQAMTQLEDKEKKFIEKAIDMTRAIPISEEINVKAPYYVQAVITSNNGDPIKSCVEERNMSIEDLETLRLTSEKLYKLFLKEDVIVAEDHIVFNITDNSAAVRLYHFPEKYEDSGTCQNETPTAADTIQLEEESKDIEAELSYLKEAIKLAKKNSKSDKSELDKPFYDKYHFQINGLNVRLKGERARTYESAENLPEIKDTFETYAKLYCEDSVVLSMESCVATMERNGCNIWLVFFNIPETKKGKKKRAFCNHHKIDADSAIDESFAERDTCEPEPVEAQILPAETYDEPVQKENDTPAIFEKAVEFARSLPIPAGVNVEHPYWVEQYISVSDDGCFSVNLNDIYNLKGRNASIDDIERLKEYSGKYIKSYYNGKYHTIFTDDYMLMKQGNTIIVRLYCTNMVNSGTSTPKDKSLGSDTLVTKRKSKAQKLAENALKYAILDVKNYNVPESIDINTPYYVDYNFCYDDIKERRWITKFLSCKGGRNMDAAKLDELKALGIEYSKLYFGESAVLTSEDCLACVTERGKIMVRIYVNPAKEGDGNSSVKPVTVVDGIEVSIVYPEIVEAVKKAKSLTAPADIDIDEPYYMQCNYDITNIGELVENGVPFASNVSADELENHRKYHKRFAEAKSAIIESADDYTAYVWDNNKRVSVFRYITNKKEVEAQVS